MMALSQCVILRVYLKIVICQERSANGDVDIPAPSDLQALDQLKEENRQLKAR